MNFGPFAGSAGDLAPGDLAPGDLAPGDLAPGDRGVLAADWTDFTIDTVRSREDPAFEEGYRRLWTEFGPKGEMEDRDVIASRLAWDPRRPEGGCALLYEMLVVRRRGEVVAVRDHTAILRRGAAVVVVHLSHVLVEPALRGSGLASWLRALPVTTARRCAALAVSGGADVPVTLVAEMERDDGVTPAVVRRLRSYAKAGFSLVDPARLDYHQPDFRSAAEIDASACTPLRLSLVIRRVGREQERSIAGAEVAVLVDALYRMFGVHQRPADMDVARRATGALPHSADEVALLVPGAVVPRESDR